MSTLRELTDRIDAVSEEVARITGEIEQIEPWLAETRENAEAVEAAIAKTRAKSESFLSTTWDTIKGGLSWWWILPLGAQLIAVAVALGLLATDGCSSPAQYRYTATSSIIAASERDLLGRACAIRVVESGPGRCAAHVDCEGRILLDDDVTCQMEEITTYDSEGSASTVERLVVHARGVDLHESSGRADFGEGNDKTRIVMHEWSSEGEL
jgi:hypothetical protein